MEVGLRVIEWYDGPVVSAAEEHFDVLLTREQAVDGNVLEVYVVGSSSSAEELLRAGVASGTVSSVMMKLVRDAFLLNLRKRQSHSGRPISDEPMPVDALDLALVLGSRAADEADGKDYSELCLVSARPRE